MYFQLEPRLLTSGASHPRLRLHFVLPFEFCAFCSIAKLLSRSALELELMLNRRHPFGADLLRRADGIPRFKLSVQQAMPLEPLAAHIQIKVPCSLACHLCA